MGRYILSAADFGKDASREVRGPVASASFFEIVQKAPDLPNGGRHLPYTEAGLRQFGPRARLRPVWRLPRGMRRMAATRTPRR